MVVSKMIVKMCVYVCVCGLGSFADTPQPLSYCQYNGIKDQYKTDSPRWPYHHYQQSTQFESLIQVKIN